MSGDYLFPKREFKKGEPFDVMEVNEALQPAGERHNGLFGPHNIRAPFNDAVPYAAGVFAKPHLAVQDCDAGITVSAGGISGGPKRVTTDAFDVGQGTAWQQITGTTDMALTMSTGRSMLAITGWAWFATIGLSSAYFGDMSGRIVDPTTGTVTGARHFISQVQFAIRIDGAIIDETITGRKDSESRTFYPIKVRDARHLAEVTPSATVPSGNATGPQLPLTTGRPDGLGRPMMAVRVGYNIEVEPGSHTVELVVRRAPGGPGRSLRHPIVGSGYIKDTDSVTETLRNPEVSVYTRGLFVMETEAEPVTAAEFNEVVTVPAFAADDVVSQASLKTDRLDVIRAASNDVKAHQISRGALNGDHLENYSTVLGSGFIEQGSPTSGSVLGSFNSTTSLYGRQLNGVNIGGSVLYPMYESSGVLNGVQRDWRLLLATTGSAANPNLDTDGGLSPLYGVLEVHANVSLEYLYPEFKTGSWTTASIQKALSAFCLGVEFDRGSGAEWRVYHPSIVFVNGNSYVGYQGGATYPYPGLTIVHTEDFRAAGLASPGAGDKIDVPITMVLDFSEYPLARTLFRFGVFGSALMAEPSANVAISAAAYNAVSLNYVMYKG